MIRPVLRALVYLGLVAAVAAVGVSEIADARRPAPRASSRVLDARALPSLVARADRAYAATAACRRSLDESVPATTRLYRRSPSPAFARWAARWWELGARDCRRTAERLAARWVPTMMCESNKDPSAGGTYWRTLVTHNRWGTFYFALQFDRATWDSHRGGLPPVAWYVTRGRPPAPASLAVVASRLSYDGWPMCPQPS